MIKSSQELLWTPFFMLLYREIRRFLKVLVQTVINPMINSALYLLIFGVSLGGRLSVSGGVSYLAFLIPGLVMMSCLNNAFQNTSSSIVIAKFGGELEDFRVSPLSYQQIIWAMGLGGLVRGFMVGAITFAVGQIFFLSSKGEWLPLVHPIWLTYFLTMGGLIFANIGISVAFWAKSVDQLSAISSFVLTPLLYLGGVFFSINNLDSVWQAVARVNPLLYLINGVRHGVLGVSDVPVAEAAVIAFGFFAITYVIAVISLHRGSFIRW